MFIKHHNKIIQLIVGNLETVNKSLNIKSNNDYKTGILRI